MGARDELQEILDRFREKDDTIQFSLITGMLAGAAAHIGSNHLFRKMLTPGGWQQRVGSSVFQSGVRHAKTGKAIHPAIRGAVDVMAGPELGHLYDAGLKSNRIARKSLALAKEGVTGKLGAGLSEIATGKRSKFADRLISWLPRSTGQSAGARIAGGAVGGAGAALVDPVLPVVNAARTLIGNSAIGKRAMTAQMRKGAEHGAQEGVGRHLQDLLVSPSLNIARDAGSTLRPAVSRYQPIKTIRGRVIPSMPQTAGAY
jgi:hypothetical protein